MQLARCRAELHVELKHSIKQLGLSQLRLRPTALVPFPVLQQGPLRMSQVKIAGSRLGGPHALSVIAAGRGLSLMEPNH